MLPALARGEDHTQPLAADPARAGAVRRRWRYGAAALKAVVVPAAGCPCSSITHCAPFWQRQGLAALQMRRKPASSAPVPVHVSGAGARCRAAARGGSRRTTPLGVGSPLATPSANGSWRQGVPGSTPSAAPAGLSVARGGALQEGARRGIQCRDDAVLAGTLCRGTCLVGAAYSASVLVFPAPSWATPALKVMRGFSLFCRKTGSSVRVAAASWLYPLGLWFQAAQPRTPRRHSAPVQPGRMAERATLARRTRAAHRLFTPGGRDGLEVVRQQGASRGAVGAASVRSRAP